MMVLFFRKRANGLIGGLMMQDTIKFILADGRELSYSEYGLPTGYPVFYCHGFPGSRLQAGDFHEPAYAKHCRFFGIDRPGMGRSTFHKQHTLLSWANDIKELADGLGIETFSVIAHSGGAPFALALGYALPERISHIALVSGMVPTTLPEAVVDMPRGYRMLNILVRNVPGFSRLLMQLQKHVLLKPAMFERLIQQLPAVDREVFKENSGLLLASKEAFYQNITGATYEFRLIMKKWGFNLDEVHTPVSIWQGGLDPQLPASCARFFASCLPNTSLRLMEHDAHQSTLYNHIEEIFEVAMP